MTLFWRHGYEGVSISDLTGAIGVAAPSLYAAFGSKAGLYREALDRYEVGIGRLNIDDLGNLATTQDAVREILMAAAATAVRNGREPGCMISVGSIACGPDHEVIRQDLARRRERLRLHLASLLVRFAGERRAHRLARSLVAVMQGLSVQARDGATSDQLAEIIDDVVEGLAAERAPDPALA
ncbi:TetR/AcrR family transcriptional regulator [Aurantimonas sp. HBX-1]|uniref:TetR/AcrR family transcriptional regulator n=1 Tax=Aurantimonas sp. HBX-1 TaxID=2906072 RepID=UPI001F274136|nr:TetR/AcrR family transcriptional regulator [Aurantimonas sp. HBX-1]UIJ71100.1 TetR/AcrR family transcriptional regulator [Aurantimonas sp. HBX-1]